MDDICGKCHVTKPVAEFIDGRGRRFKNCNRCRAGYSSHLNDEKLLKEAAAIGGAICVKCKKVHPAELFIRDRHRYKTCTPCSELDKERRERRFIPVGHADQEIMGNDRRSLAWLSKRLR